MNFIYEFKLAEFMQKLKNIFLVVCKISDIQ